MRNHRTRRGERRWRGSRRDDGAGGSEEGGEQAIGQTPAIRLAARSAVWSSQSADWMDGAVNGGAMTKDVKGDLLAGRSFPNWRSHA